MTSEAPSLLLLGFGGLKNKAAKHREDKVNFKACRSPSPTRGHNLHDGQAGRVQRAGPGLPPGLLTFSLKETGIQVNRFPCSFF